MSSIVWSKEGWIVPGKGVFKTKVEAESVEAQGKVRLGTFDIEYIDPLPEPRFALKTAHLTADVFEKMAKDKTIFKPDIVVYTWLTFNMSVKKGQTHRITRSEITSSTGLSDRVVRRILTKLTTKGYIIPIERATGKNGLMIFELVLDASDSGTG